MGGNWLFLYEAYQQIGVGTASLLCYCGPVIVMALAPILFHESLTLHKCLGLLVVLLREGMSLMRFLGVAFILGGAMFAEMSTRKSSFTE